MSKPRKDEPLKMPAYKGGNDALRRFIQTNLKYPKEALERKIEGLVKATYDVDGLGRVLNIKIVEGLGYGCDEEVLRLVSLLKYEKAFNKGRNVTLHRTIKVDFKLPKQKPKANTTISYQLVVDKQKQEKKGDTPKKISYTIKF